VRGGGVSASQFKVISVIFFIPVVLGLISYFMDYEVKDLLMLFMLLFLFAIYSLHYRFFGPIIRQILRLEERLQKEADEKL
jgi:sensor histidine kinase YesM